MSRSTMLVVMAFAAALPAATGTAAASGRWHTHLVRYADHSRSPWDVRTAVAQWNHAQTGVRLVPARHGLRAQITITARGCPITFPGHSPGGPCAMFPPDGRTFLASRTDGFGDARDSQLTAHELGHALGLDHAGGCSVMVPNLMQKECKGFSCGPTKADARRLVARYGGHVRSWKPGRGCFWFLPLPQRASATLVAPRGPADAPAYPPFAVIPAALPVRLRNDSSWTWGRHVWGPDGTDEVELLTVDAAGRRVGVPDNCPRSDGVIGDVQRNRSAGPVRHGETGTFDLRVCAPYADETIHLRPYTVGRGVTLPAGQVITVQLRGQGSSDPGAPGGPNQPPVASFTFESSGDGTGTVFFHNTATDPDGTLVSWSWDFGDPSSPDNASQDYEPTHTFTGPGTYTVRLTVTDDGGATASTEQQVTP